MHLVQAGLADGRARIASHQTHGDGVNQNAYFNSLIGSFLREYIVAAESLGLSRIKNNNVYELSFYRVVKLENGIDKITLRKWLSGAFTLPYEKWQSLISGEEVCLGRISLRLRYSQEDEEASRSCTLIPSGTKIVIVTKKSVKRPADLILRGWVDQCGKPNKEVIKELAGKDRVLSDRIEKSINSLKRVTRRKGVGQASLPL